MSKSQFERTPTTRTDTLLVSDKRVMEQFQRAVEKTLESAEEAATFAGAISDSDLSLALVRLEQIQNTVERAHRIVQARLDDKPVEDFRSDEFNLLGEFADFESSAVIDDSDMDAQIDDDEPVEGLISVSESANILGLSMDEVIALMNSGELQAIANPGGQIMLEEEAVRARKPKEAEPSSDPELEDFDDILDRLFE